MSKNRVIVEAVLAGRSHAAVAEQYGISKVRVGKLMARWRAGGLEAVDKRSTRPRPRLHRVPCRILPGFKAPVTVHRDYHLIIKLDIF